MNALPEIGKAPTFRFLPLRWVVSFFWIHSTYLLPLSLAATPLEFNKDIRPLLAEHCLHCHGPDSNTREGDLRLDLESEAKKKAILEGDPDSSPLIQRVITKDPDDRMPPPEEGIGLSNDETHILRQWIQQGAPYEGHWAFEPIRKLIPPDVGQNDASEIDRFVLFKLHQADLSMAPPVSRSQWIRRVTFDLTGLPPTWKEVEAYVLDPSPEAEAEEKVVDRLLESPRYGEHWGRHWLDIARYADTHGGSAIGFTKFPFSFTYRDYVIGAFNNDLPYNRFVIEQLAADQLDLSENDPSLAALGFLTIGQRFRSPHDIVDDQIDVITRGLMGLTVTCARCHDHKFDPIPTTDYYALYATLANSEEPDLLPVIGKPATTESYQEYQAQLTLLQNEYDDMAREQSAVLRGRLRMQVGKYLKELVRGTPEQDLSVSFLSFRTDDLRPHVLERWRTYLKDMPSSDPVFGPWIQLTGITSKDFSIQCSEMVDRWIEENGDLSKATPMENLGATPPKWNPMVLGAIKTAKPESMEAVAEAYGKLFADTHREWTLAQMQAADEAMSDGTIIPDQDKRHLTINSAILRQLRRHLYAVGSPTELPEILASKLLNRTVSDNLNGRNSAIHNHHLHSKGSPPRSMALMEKAPDQKQVFHVFRRGNHMDKGDQVHPRFMTALSSGEPAKFPEKKQRFHLAQSVVSLTNPLTRRVIVNWVWRHHFGQGLVRTPDDFGTRGDQPTHLELLDYLAEDFSKNGWSLKKIHKRILLTETYRQSAVENSEARIKDPENKFLWRMPRHRLGLEAMRDAMLIASGELDTSMGGRPFDMLKDNVTPRRSVYGFVNRDVPSTLLTTFDGANPSACTAKRPETTVPQQTLFALNSTFIRDRSKALVQIEPIRSADSDKEKIRLLYQRTLARLPDPIEMDLAIEHIRDWKNLSDRDPWQQLAHALLASNEFIFVD